MPLENSRTVTWMPPGEVLPRLAEMSGLDYLRGLRDGTVPAPPMARLINATVTEVETGRVEFICDPGEEHYNPLGTVHGGLVCTLLDTAAGCAAHTTLEAGASYTSIEIKVSYLRAVTIESGPLTATATVTKAGSRVVFVDAIACDQSGILVASASSSLLVLRK